MLMATTPTAPDTILPLLKVPTPPWQRIALFAAWLIVAGWLAAHHVFWRDEVRAFSLALSGDTTADMLGRIHGEGHPALWYLLLRGAHAIIGTRAALPFAAFAIGAGAAGLWAWRAPFRPLVIAFVLFGGFMLYEYTVSARNYGIAMLGLFAFAAAYPRAKRHGPWLGLILALTCNTNAPAVMLAGALRAVLGSGDTQRGGLALDPALATLGRQHGARRARRGAVCIAVIFPPFNDAAVSPLAGQLSPATLAAAALNVTAPFSALLPETWWTVPGTTLLLAAMVVGAPLGLVRSPGGLAAGLLILVAMPLFFQIVYPGGYRHQALFVVFLLTLYWLVAQGGGGRWPPRVPLLRPTAQALLQRFGQAALLALLLTQVAIGAERIAAAATGVPEGRTADLAALIHRDHLDRAVVIANPDVLLEPLPYYAGNPLWLTRERHWGKVVAFTKAAERDVTLAETLTTARRLRVRTHRPVLILLQVRLDPTAAAQTWDEGYLGTFSTTPGDVRAFVAATRRLASFAPTITDESYDVYLLR